jgi:hypothetical protein
VWVFSASNFPGRMEALEAAPAIAISSTVALKAYIFGPLRKV